MDELAINVLFGHVVGDFFLQHRLMAENKHKPGWIGTSWCALHAAVYTITVAVFAGITTPVFLLGVAIPHWVADRYSLGYRWMQLIGRSNLITNSDPTQAAFGAIVYVTIDQTFHLGSLYVLLLVLQP